MRKYLKLLIILVLVFSGTFISSFYLYPSQNTNSTPPSFSSVVLGQTEYGTVTRYGPYGNASSPNCIAYVVGVHPLEYQSHDAIVETIKTSDKSLKNCYYIYKINVTQNPDNYNKGRTNGQNLANKYAIPNIKNNSIKLVIDVHSNEGNYKVRKFLFIPASSEKALKIAGEIKNKTNWLTIYSPPEPTSPSYVTIPLIQAGIPAMIYETYTYESVEQTRKQSIELVSIIDNLKLN
ncbi:hypothetical protein DSECCO2_390820 [anaerobic digester metagenome]|uniref:Deacylase n=1 Tax=Methanobacterium subterraneum TaxID=59277 RepID=A0A2H4VP78_9EURY|nr:hypothetical protein [Methanobacterium subterraneum]AUB59876.1 hypothetical protein BK009_03810 [Methanobacterium subterraneum]